MKVMRAFLIGVLVCLIAAPATAAGLIDRSRIDGLFRDRFNQVERSAADRQLQRFNEIERGRDSGSAGSPASDEIGQRLDLCRINPTLPQCQNGAAQ
jgi:hypothetical protein